VVSWVLQMVARVLLCDSWGLLGGFKDVLRHCEVVAGVLVTGTLRFGC